MAAEVEVVAAPLIVTVGDGVEGYKSNSVARVGEESHEGATTAGIIVALEPEPEMETRVVGLFDIRGDSHTALPPIALKVISVIAAVAVSSTDTIGIKIAPVTEAIVGVFCLETKAPVGLHGAATGGEESRSWLTSCCPTGGRDDNFVAVVGAGLEAGDVVGTGNAGIGEGVGVGNYTQGNIGDRAHSLEREYGTCTRSTVDFLTADACGMEKEVLKIAVAVAVAGSKA